MEKPGSGWHMTFLFSNFFRLFYITNSFFLKVNIFFINYNNKEKKKTENSLKREDNSSFCTKNFCVVSEL